MGKHIYGDTQFKLRQKRYLLVAFTVCMLSGCATHYTFEASSDPYGFFSGIWHGLIFPYALLANLVSWCLSLFGVDFLSDIQLVGRPNTGFLFYYVGYFFGLGMYGGGRYKIDLRDRPTKR